MIVGERKVEKCDGCGCPHNVNKSQSPGNEEGQDGEREATLEMMGVNVVAQKVERKGIGDKYISE